MTYHDVSIERDGEHSEDGDGQEAVAHHREQGAEGLAVHPGPVVEERRGQWQVEAAKHEIRHAQIDDEHGRGIPNLRQKTTRIVLLLVQTPKLILS